MAFQLSPGVNVSEIDLTTIVPAVGTTEGGYVGRFQWGPINEVTTIGNEIELADTFGKPDSNTFIDFFTAANFLAYARNLKLVRAANTSIANNATSGQQNLIIKNNDDYVTTWSDLSANNLAGAFAARYAGELGNSLKVSIFADSQGGVSWTENIWEYVPEFDAAPDTSTYVDNLNGSGDEMHIIVIDEDGAFSGRANTVLEKFAFVSKASDARNDDGSSNYYINVINDKSKYVYIVNHPSVGHRANISNVTITTTGAYDANYSGYIAFSGGSGTGANVAFAANTGGYITTANLTINSRGTEYVLNETVTGTIVGGNGTSTITVTLQNNPDTTANWGQSAANTSFVQAPVTYTASLSGGLSGTVTDANRITAYDLFSNADEVDISLVMTGAANTAVVQHVIDNLATSRKDCVAFVSPRFQDVVNQVGLESSNIIGYKDLIGRSTSYAVMDSSWKYQFDKYNNVYRWVPCNGDIAGLCVRTDYERDPWYSPAGFNRGQLKNVVKLSYNPDKADRDDLYKNGVNPICTFRGEGTILYGDKTMQAKPSAFDRINVRRLFIVLEKAIARAAKYSLFEFNDSFTRAQFVALVEPYLRDVQGRRGIYDFRVVCDETNNTPEVIDRNEFIGDIYIKPARSINFIQLNFVAVRTGVAFDEIVGKF
jgi:phage tail sheath protein FI